MLVCVACNDVLPLMTMSQKWSSKTRGLFLVSICAICAEAAWPPGCKEKKSDSWLLCLENKTSISLPKESIPGFRIHHDV